MTKLNCSVTNCYHNKNRLCCLSSIKVDGTTADVSDGTACASFKGKGSESYTNSCGCSDEPKDSINIECDAQKCVFNNSSKCVATSVTVDGDSACTCRETKCSTFKM